MENGYNDENYKENRLKILSRALVITDGVWIGDWNY
jgi:hypothetical protein